MAMAKLRRPRERQHIIIKRPRLSARVLPLPVPVRAQQHSAADQQEEDSKRTTRDLLSMTETLRNRYTAGALL